MEFAAARGAAEGPVPAAIPVGQQQNVDATVALTISGTAPKEVRLHDVAIVDFRVEPTALARPLQGARVDVTAQKATPIRVFISVHGDATVYGRRFLGIMPPEPGTAVQDAFEIHVSALGDIAVTIHFRQGQTELARLLFEIGVVDDKAVPSAQLTGARLAVVPADLFEETGVDLFIEERRGSNEVYYRYVLFAESLDLGCEEFTSPRLLDRTNSPAAGAMAYVDWVYRRVERKIVTVSDGVDLTTDVRATGLQMAEELLDPAFVRLIWPHRARIRTVRIIAWEPYIPWELLRLRHPDSGEVDDRYFCEYGLIRESRGQRSTRRLAMRDWSCLEAAYPADSKMPSIYGQAQTLHKLLDDRGVALRKIEPARAAAIAALSEGNFDILHIVCHGSAELDDINSAQLIIGERAVGGGKMEPISIDPVTVGQEARMALQQRRPIVFLNACESGRQGASLTAWGGWPTAFLKAGANVFVGAAWPVREAPAAAFATAFYTTLLEGKTLVEATNAARAAARIFPDASWISYRVFGHPQARMSV